MQDAITSIDSNLARDLLALFPGGVNSLGEMSDEDIQAIINDKDRGAVNICKVLRAQHGSTALLVLQDPSRENIWIAGLGDCSASRPRSSECHLVILMGWQSSFLTTHLASGRASF
jgi:pyruvate dehydrogenase phosphatase